MSCGTCPASGQLPAQTSALSGGQVMLGWAVDVEQWFRQRQAQNQGHPPVVRLPDDTPASGAQHAPDPRLKLVQAAQALLQDKEARMWVTQAVGKGMGQAFLGTDVSIPQQNFNPRPNTSGVSLVCLVVRRKGMSEEFDSSTIVGYLAAGRWVHFRRDWADYDDAVAQIELLREEVKKSGCFFCLQCGAILENEQCPNCGVQRKP